MQQKYKALLLASGGIDSPVAGWMMVEKAIHTDAIHFNNEPFVDEKSLEKTKRLMKKIGIKKMYIIEHGKIQAEIIKNCKRRFQCVLCRRFMFKVSERVANEKGYDFLVTGENLGQVASQTLTNMETTSEAVKIKILRPLLCNDKVETMAIARKIGTYNISIEPGMCCNMTPKHPATAAKIEAIKIEEEKLDVEEIIKNAIENIVEISL